jgi:RNA 2',3'-cyclic 3'-phosphodiesterase
MLADSVRTFLAIGIPETEQHRLAAVQSQFSRQAATVKWVRPEMLHLTVRFLGNISRQHVSKVLAAAHQSAARIAPFSSSLAGLGAFPNDRNPKTIWVGLQQDGGLVSLKRLFELTEDALVNQGFAREPRLYSPHLTLGRVRDAVGPAQRRALGEELRHVRAGVPLSGSIPVRELLVMASRLDSNGPTYTVTGRASLQP